MSTSAAQFEDWVAFRSELVEYQTMSICCLNCAQRYRLSDSVREIKKASSRWVHTEIDLKSFAWQESYAAFSVDYRGIEAVRRYIADQEVHHGDEASRDEIVRLLADEGVEYDHDSSNNSGTPSGCAN
jgi:hypothetical protein